MQNLTYDPETGVITRKVQQGNYPVGSVCHAQTHCKRYLKVTVAGKTMLQHRAAWTLHTGEPPPEQIDHIDGNGLNNKWSNLRAACPSTNQRNIGVHTRSTTGIKGIMPVRGGSLFRAEVCVNGKRYQKHSKDIKLLQTWVVAKRQELHGLFARD